LIADQGIITAGAVDVVRSAQAEREELLFILAIVAAQRWWWKTARP